MSKAMSFFASANLYRWPGNGVLTVGTPATAYPVPLLIWILAGFSPYKYDVMLVKQKSSIGSKLQKHFSLRRSSKPPLLSVSEKKEPLKSPSLFPLNHLSKERH